MPTLLLSPRYGQDSIILRRAALELGWDVERLVHWRCPDDLKPGEPVLYGEPLFLAAIAEQLGITLIEPPADFLTRLPLGYVQRQIQLMNGSEAKRQPSPAFFKPPNLKTFPARVYANGLELPESLLDDELVLVSEAVPWSVEFRFFVLDRRPLAWSPYWRDGRTAYENDQWTADPEATAIVRSFVDQVLNDANLDFPRAFVLDAGLIAGKGPAIVEANDAAASGIYGCDPFGVLDVIRFATIKSAQTLDTE